MPPSASSSTEGSSAGGTLELAVSGTRIEGSDPLCTLAGDAQVMRPDAFERALVESARVSERSDAVVVQLTADGAAVLHDLSDRAARKGSDARLILKIGDQLRAVVVKEPLSGESLTIGLSPDDDPAELLELLTEEPGR